MPKVISRAEAREQGLTKYFTGKPCKNGHIAERYTKTCECSKCIYERTKKYTSTERGREKKKELASAWGKNNRDKVNSYRQKWINKNPEKTKEYKNKRLNDPIIREHDRKIENESKRRNMDKIVQRRRDSITQTIKHRLQSRISVALKSKGLRKLNFTEELIGCSINEFKKYFEKKFEKDMSWENRKLWDIDHIIPVDYFIKNYDFSNIKIQQICFHFSNLQPLWSVNNLKKNNKISKQIAEKKIAEIKKLINA